MPFMLQDRPYMRDNTGRRRTSVLPWLISFNVAVYLIQNVFARLPGAAGGLESALGLSAQGIKSGHLWTLLTYGFLHDTGNLLQIVGYLLTIYFIGRELLPMLGARRFGAFYAASVVAGGLFWTAVHWGHPAMVIGSSAAVAALIVLFACFYPNREITMLLLFIPVRFKPKHLAFLMVVLDLAGLVFYEIIGAASPFGAAAHSAHLGGMATGWIYYRYIHDARWGFKGARADIELPRWMKHRASATAIAPAPAFSVNMGGPEHLRAEVDRILDKINSDGFGSLSAEEKKVLDEARGLIGRR
jgi:membrane associated rhomboid family serine protease